MIKSKLVEIISNRQPHLSKQDIAFCVNVIFERIHSSLIQHERVELRDFGSFCLRFRPARKARNPRTGEVLTTNPKYRLHFKPGKEMKERIDASRLGYPIKNGKNRRAPKE